MRIKFITATFACTILSTISFAATEVNDMTKVHDRLATYIEKNHSSYGEGEAEAGVAMSVYQSALAILDGNSEILYEAQQEKTHRIRSYEQIIDTLNEEFEGLLTSIKFFRQNLAVVDNAHFGVVTREERGGIKFTPNLFVPKLPVQLNIRTVLDGENDRNGGMYRFIAADKYKAFSLSEEEYANFGKNHKAFIKAFKISRTEDISLSIAESNRRAEELSTKIEGLRSQKVEIMQEIEDEMAAYVRARSAINLHQIGEIKTAFQIYGNALNSKRGRPLEAKERINDLIPTLDPKTTIWLANLLPESEFTVVTKKKRRSF